MHRALAFCLFLAAVTCCLPTITTRLIRLASCLTKLRTARSFSLAWPPRAASWCSVRSSFLHGGRFLRRREHRASAPALFGAGLRQLDTVGRRPSTASQSAQALAATEALPTLPVQALPSVSVGPGLSARCGAGSRGREPKEGYGCSAQYRLQFQWVSIAQYWYICIDTQFVRTIQ